jgi:hypothetical protein
VQQIARHDGPAALAMDDLGLGDQQRFASRVDDSNFLPVL